MHTKDQQDATPACEYVYISEDEGTFAILYCPLVLNMLFAMPGNSEHLSFEI